MKSMEKMLVIEITYKTSKVFYKILMNIFGLIASK